MWLQLSDLRIFRLIFMPYNGWLMIAVAVGASIGHYAFGIHTGSAKSVACH
jgi:solute carrier family 31 (copper transporter), member 1